MSLIKQRNVIVPIIKQELTTKESNSSNSIITQKVNTINKTPEISSPNNIISKKEISELKDLDPIPDNYSLSTIIQNISQYIIENDDNNYNPVISSNTIIESLLSLKFIVEKYLIKGNYLSEFKTEQEKYIVRKNINTFSTTEIIQLIDKAIQDLRNEMGENVADQITEIIQKISEIESKLSNITSDDVIFTKDLVITADVGVHTIPSSGYKTLETTDKSLTQVMNLLFSERKVPTITLPFISSVTLQNSGIKEVGTQFQPSYTVTFNSGNYQYGPNTDVVVKSYNIVDTNNNTSTQQSGSFNSFTITDSTNYKIKATISYSDGSIPKDNLGNDYTEGQILAGTTNLKESSNVTGYRKYFYGYYNTVNELNSDTIRGLQYQSTSAYQSGKQFTLVAPSGTKQIIIACIDGKIGPTHIQNNTITQTVTSTFNKTENILVEGYNNYEPVNYNVWTYVADIPYKNEVSLTITLG